MKKNIELKWNELKTSYQSADFTFKTTDELEVEEGMLSPGEAVEMLEFGLQLKAKGYNIYVSGQDEKSLYQYVLKKVNEAAQKENIPDDICYIYNFENPTSPKCITMKAGDGKKFQDDMKELKHFLIEELSERLESYEAEKRRQKLVDELDEKKEALLTELRIGAKELGFQVKLTKEGIGFIPLDKDGEPLDAHAYETLDVDKKESIKEEVDKLYQLSEDAIQEIKALEKEYRIYMEDLDQEIVINEVAYYISYIKNQYGNYKEVQSYIDAILNDILENIEVFSNTKNEEVQGINQLIPWLCPKTSKDVVGRYDINVLIDNSHLKGAPIVTGYPLGYGNLIGKIKVDNELNTLHTDFMNIYAGLLHQANGGYLVIYMNDLIESQGAWEGIKRALKTGKVIMENLGGANITTTLGMTPEPANVKVKIILIGSYEIYNVLAEYDRSFKELFKVNVNFSETIQSDTDSMHLFARLIKAFCEKEKLPYVTKEGIIRLLEYSHRYAESKEKISANMQPVFDLIREASMFAEEAVTEENIVTAKRIKMVFKETLQKNIEEKYEKNIFMIDTTGKQVGQINGLAVYEVDEFSFGRPIRITATTYMGKSGVVDVESAVGLSGSIHSKGVQIITGFLGNYFAREYPLSLCCRICFEQSYGGIDGDSASSAELYAVLSSLAEVPIRQGIAVTGSINQYGQIQPVGGVNDKIEGFYRVCKKKGLTGNQGVIIPYQNKEDLMLEDEVIGAIKDGKFHIYAISSFKEGIQLLSGKSYKEIETKVKNKLYDYSDKSGSIKNKQNKENNTK